MRSAAIHATLGALALTAAAVLPGDITPGGLPLPLRDAREAVGAAKAAEAAEAAGIGWSRCPAAEELPASTECGSVTIPVDYADPDGEKFRLAVSRKRATGPAALRRGPLLHNPGGPGADGMDFPLHATVPGGVWKKLNRSYDLVGYAPRGVGRSGPLLCADPDEADSGASRSPRVPSEAFKRQMRRQAAAFARACAREHGARLDHFTTADNARDLDVLRAALHRERTDFIGTSYGSYLGAVYATLFPERVGRLVLDSVVDPRPDRVWYRNGLEQNKAFQRRWGDFMSWVAEHDSAYGLGRTAHTVQRNFDRARDALDHGSVGGWAGDGVGSRQLLRGYLDAGYSDESWPRLARALADFREGDPRALAELAAPGRRASAQRMNSDSVYRAVQCSEGHWPRDWSRWDRDNTALAREAPFQTWENLRANLPCAYWQGRSVRPVDVGATPGELPPVLLLASTRDAATPYEGAVETWKRLPGSSLVTERGSGTHGVAGGSACADRHLAAYLLDGRTPGRAAECPAPPGPRP
ncbi:alpha/beta hydrolase [Streptomyces bathyalis]|uniref:Alpha/beta hydrolase n=1 Tax=Streptomyces bathyalis TaxID=2710756 RepID=A0A7T1T410_9ACTN|nr:alpha/beta hydrolase [Streptomyces bathyalis]QPP06003.1 alpha/beta hydrolase [Streptomyces bathyalis]